MAYEDVLLALNPTSRWKHGEASAAPGVVDSVGAEDGTYDGSGITYSEPGLIPTAPGTSVKLDATVGGAMNMPDVYDFPGNQPFAAIGWGKLEEFSAANGHFIFCKRDNAPTQEGWALALNPAAIVITASRIIGGTFQEATHSVAESALEGSVHMYGIHYDGTDLSIVLDGPLFGTVASPGSLVGHGVPLTFGKFSDGGGSTWDGWLQDLVVFDGNPPAEAELIELYEAGISEILSEPRGYRRVVGPVHLPNVASDLYTVPEGNRFIVRNLLVTNPSGSEIEFTLSVGADAASTRLLDQKTVPAGRFYTGRRATNFTIEAGETIQGFADVAATAVVVIDGFMDAQ